MPIVETIKSKAQDVYGKGLDFVKEHPYKTAATFGPIALVTSLTAAYFLSPAYTTFVGTVGTKAATLVSPAITAISAFAVAHPLIASLVIVAAVAAIIAAPMLAYKNNNKAAQIEKLVKIVNGIKNEESPSTLVDDIRAILGLEPLKKV